MNMLLLMILNMNVLLRQNCIIFISHLLIKTVDELKELFTNVTELQIVDEEDVVRGSYENLKFISVEEVVGSVSEDDDTSVPSVIVKLYIKSQLEVDVDTLKVTQDEQDEIISELVFGTEEV